MLSKTAAVLAALAKAVRQGDEGSVRGSLATLLSTEPERWRFLLATEVLPRPSGPDVSKVVRSLLAACAEGVGRGEISIEHADELARVLFTLGTIDRVLKIIDEKFLDLGVTTLPVAAVTLSIGALIERTTLLATKRASDENTQRAAFDPLTGIRATLDSPGGARQSIVGSLEELVESAELALRFLRNRPAPGALCVSPR